MECSICGISGSMRNVFEVISPKGVIFACEKCVLEEGFPILKKPDKKVFEESERRGTVYERMTRLSGIKPREPEKPELRRQEKSLREIIDRNYEEKIKKQYLSLKSRSDLVDKFHWIIMRVRRVKGFTQKQLAEAIKETEAAIKMAEQGVVPEGYELIDKLERFLKVKLIKERTRPSDAELKDRISFMLSQKKEKNIYGSSWLSKDRPNSNIHNINERNQQTFSQPQKSLESPKKTLGLFDKQSLDSLKIADLQRMKREREEARREAMLKETRPSVAELRKTYLGVVDLEENPHSDSELEKEAEMWEDKEMEDEDRAESDK